ncbi:MAG: hypothetical protein KGJ07_05190 [Patescibacteria group bacterium]|nr:hypothetical protein [Patescibacteria group bacterium]
MNTNTYSRKPFVIGVKEAHEKKIIVYNEEGIVIFSHPNGDSPKTIYPDHQYSLIRPTFDDLNKALSSTANSPLLTGDKSLRNQFEHEKNSYEKLVEEVESRGEWEPEYGTYVFDYITQNLYIIAPQFWHRLGLVTNNSKLMTDPEKKFSWHHVRNIFDNAVIGVVGASVGGNILEGCMREIRPKTAKIADYDWVEITNLNRLERGSLRFLAASKAERMDLKNSFDVTRVSKAEVAAYEQHMLDPYAEWYVYSEGIHEENIQQFLLGNENEPRLDILIEECDDLRIKLDLRKQCRKHKIPLLMISDWGHMVEAQFYDYKNNPSLSMGYKTSDETIETQLNTAMESGKREDRFSFIRSLCGPEFEVEEFGMWVRGEGEQPTSSLPQSGSTAMASGGIGGKLVAYYLLGYTIPQRIIFDFKKYKIIID